MSDLSSFNITHFAGGKQNLKLVDSIPARASANLNPSSTSAASPSAAPLSVFSSNQSSSASSSPSFPPTLLQLFYPKDSINPAQKPQGGAEFYAHPIDLQSSSSSSIPPNGSTRRGTGAQNVSLEYQVFFPADFEWVWGGKLPGLYGGREGCSGGKDAGAMECFSTRLMWRSEGQGELYLYAPRDKQSAALCNDPQSVCDAEYGFSVGRGSFRFKRGDWTRVRQTVVLNTPGERDGWFWLDVDGVRVIQRWDVFYRDVPGAMGRSGSGQGRGTNEGKEVGGKTEGGGKGRDGKGDKDAPSEGGLFGSGGLLDGILRRRRRDGLVSRGRMPLIGEDGEQQFFDVGSQGQSDDEDSGSKLSSSEESESEDDELHATGFSGLFFSTFFGGHEKGWASPKDQYVWFKGFAMTVNG
ncbi:polysaccharide lyase family 14 protein [Collybiopsis luxurians FD-317 M1]|uniref:Unplaced genomic scaffold GYMLUscaffold_33, whole genome shotgun sequence n=1 Tax=Collybiopsis luxurians FD-317 M1 TaxID=944289 RepID=A0A0D0CL09_9AGAR|nr:polysaccharide lyase family 14 protein [Collybiopsis luxurians FD-317 M1]